MRHSTVSALVLTAAAAFAGHAYAGNCDTPTNQGNWVDTAVMNKQLKDDGQHIIFMLNTINEFDHGGQLHALAVTAKSDGSTGYIIETNQPINSKSPSANVKATRMCVYDRISNIQVFSPSTGSLSQLKLASIKFVNPQTKTVGSATQETAIRKCNEMEAAGEISKKSCGFLDESLNRLSGQGPLLRAFGAMTKNGQVVPNNNLVITLTAEVDSAGEVQEGNIFYSMLPSGATLLDRSFIGTDPTKLGTNQLSGPVASSKRITPGP